jgi:hypothetical protein
MPIMTRKRNEEIHPDVAGSLREWFAIHTVIRADFTRLPAAQQHQVVELVEKGQRRDESGDPRGGIDWERLTKAERRKLVGLMERLGGLEAGTFAAREQEARDLAELRELGRQVTMPPPRVRHEEPGSLRIPASVFTGMTRSGRVPSFRVGTLGIFAFIAGALECGSTGNDHTRIDGTGDAAVFVIEPRLGSLFLGDVPDWDKRLKHLDKIGWLSVDRSTRGQIRVARGPKLLKALHAGDR